MKKNIFINFKGIINFIISSNSNKGQIIYRLFLFLCWQFYKRVVALPIISKLDNNSLFILHPNSTNATANIYVNTYESEFIDFLRKNLPQDGILIDVGAHMGIYSLLLNDKFIKGYLFEPSSDTFQILQDNLYLNRFNDKFHAYNLCVSNSTKTVKFNQTNVLSGTNSISHSEEDASNATIKNAISLDGFIKEIDEITFIKIDVEGHEFEILSGAVNILKNSKNLILLYENSNFDQIYTLLNAINYTIFSISKKGELIRDVNHLRNAYNLIAISNSHEKISNYLQ
jgi:FkbM family methyltransferase